MLLDKLISKRVARIESELLEKYYAEVEHMYDKCAAGGATTDTIYR